MHSIRHRMHSIRHRISSRQRHRIDAGIGAINSRQRHGIVAWRRELDPLCYYICMCMCVGGCQSSCEFAHRTRKKPTHSHMRGDRGKQTHVRTGRTRARAQHSPLGTDVHQRSHACTAAHTSMQGARVRDCSGVGDSSSRLRRRRQEWASTSTRALGVAVAVCALFAPFRRCALKSSSARPYTREHAWRGSICVRTGLGFRV
jgi:hypothetical protein